jgi:hypothetical protein
MMTHGKASILGTDACRIERFSEFQCRHCVRALFAAAQFRIEATQHALDIGGIRVLEVAQIKIVRPQPIMRAYGRWT